MHMKMVPYRSEMLRVFELLVQYSCTVVVQFFFRTVRPAAAFIPPAKPTLVKRTSRHQPVISSAEE
jgi:hypothetical protein